MVATTTGAGENITEVGNKKLSRQTTHKNCKNKAHFQIWNSDTKTKLFLTCFLPKSTTNFKCLFMVPVLPLQEANAVKTSAQSVAHGSGTL